MRNAVLRALAIAAGGLALGAADAAPAGVPSDPQAIFAASRSAWAFTSYPRYANYSVGVRYRNGGATVARQYDALEDLRRAIVFAQSFSHEETANPSFPAHGVNLGMLGMTINTAQADDPIGPPALAITYDFGISLAARPTQVAQLGSEVTSPARYPVIGRSGASARTYDVRLIEMLDDGATYHLGLTPLRDPKRYRLREMWVTAKTFITQKILIAANFSREPFTSVPWLITFKQIDGGPYIAEERALGALDFGDAGSLDDVTITFDDIQATSELPRYGTVGINGGAAEFVTEP
jgi:hypothetical protein